MMSLKSLLLRATLALCCLLSPLFSITLKANNYDVLLTDETRSLSLNAHSALLIDESGDLRIEKILTHRNTQRFVPNSEGRTTFGFSEHPHWFRIELDNLSKRSNWILEIDYPLLDFVDLYVYSADGMQPVSRSGDRLPFSSRSVKHRNLVFDLDIPEGATLFIRVQTTSTMQVPINLYTPAAFLEADRRDQILFGLYYGLVLVMAVYHLFLFLPLRNASILSFALYAIFMGLYGFSSDGLAFEFLWPESTAFARRSTLLFVSLTMLAGIQFTRQFLHTRDITPRLDRYSLMLMGAIAAVAGVVLIMPQAVLAIKILYIIGPLATIFCTVAGVVALKRGDSHARFFILAISALLFMPIVFVLKDFGILQLSFFAAFSLKIGSAAQITLFSFGIADRINTLRLERESAQATALASRDRMLEAERKANHNLKRLHKFRERLAHAKRLESAGQVAGQIAHDFNNLLGPLVGYPELIREDVTHDKHILPLVNEIEASARKIADINQQLLSLGRRGHYATEAINLNDLLISTLNSLQFPDKITIVKHLEPELMAIRGGYAQLGRVFANVFTNAIEAMRPGGTLSVTTRNYYLDRPIKGYKLVKKGEYIRVDIADTGSGIDKRIMRKIFEPFFTTKEMDRMRGSGLGLSVVHGIVEDHRGYIRVKSVVSKGTLFSFYFPIARKLEARKELRPTPEYRGTESILVVDDDPVQRRVLKRILDRYGYEVEVAGSGEDAVAMLRKQQMDLVLLDMVMKRLDGTQTYEEILKFRPEQKAILLSGYAKSDRVKLAMDLGAGQYLAKPVQPLDLAAAVRRELERDNNIESPSEMRISNGSRKQE